MTWYRSANGPTCPSHIRESPRPPGISSSGWPDPSASYHSRPPDTSTKPESPIWSSIAGKPGRSYDPFTATAYPVPMSTKIAKADDQWRAELTPEQYKVLRQKGTERAFTGRYWDEQQLGTYRCAGCGTPRFSSDAKFESGTGWPSFTQPAAPDAVETEQDRSFFMSRTEAVCATCGGHLGHV